MNLNWQDIIGNAVSTFIAAIVIGAGIVVWTAASTMDKKIDTAKTDLSKQQDSITGTQEILKAELSSLKTSVEILEKQIEQIQTQLAEANKVILPSIQEQGLGLEWQGFSQPTVPSAVESDELKEKNLDRLDKLLDKYRLE